MSNLSSEYSLLNRFMFRPPKRKYNPSDFDGNFIWLGKHPCVLLRHESAHKFIIYFHANAVDLAGTYDYAKRIHNYFEANLLIVEYPGYGLSPGYPSEFTTNNCAMEIYDYTKQVLGVKSSQIVLLGHSIGTGIAIDLCYRIYNEEKQEIASLILLSPFKSICSVLRYNVGRLISKMFTDRFVSIDKIGDIKCQTMVFHGIDDDLIPFMHSVELSKKSPNSALFLINKMGHTQNYELEEDILKKVELCFDFHSGDICYISKKVVYRLKKRNERNNSVRENDCLPKLCLF